MDLKQLHLFLTLSQTNSFTKTGEILGYSQSNVSSQINQLELELGGPLFNRHGHSITLSAKGKQLLPYAEKMIALSNDVKRNISTSDMKSLSIIISESLCTYILPDALTSYNSLYPDSELHINLSDENYYTSLQNGSADFAFVLESEPYHVYSNILYTFPLKIGLFISPNNPHGKKSINEIAEIENSPLLLTGVGCPYRKKFLNLMNDANVVPNIALETGSIQALKEMAIAGLGICILPNIAVKREVSDGKLIPICFSSNIFINASIITHKDKILPTYAKSLIDALIDKSNIISA